MGALVSSGSAVAARFTAVAIRQSARSSHGIRCGVKMKPGQLHIRDSERQEQIQSKQRISRTITHTQKTHIRPVGREIMIMRRQHIESEEVNSLCVF